MLRSLSTISEPEFQDKFEAQKLEAEERQTGNLKLSVVVAYFRAGGSAFFFMLTLFMILVTAASAAAADYWISYWYHKYLNQVLN